MASTKRRQPSRTIRRRVRAASTATGSSPGSKKHYTRPGVAAAARLASLRPASGHADAWERASSRYAAMIEAKGGAELVELDERREEIAKGWKSKSSACLSKEQLLDVVIEWKFAKGKPRHALRPLLKSNSDASVSAASKSAFRTADGIPENDASAEHSNEISLAINQLCELRGVGPATASAVLCMRRPDAFAFMDDEVIECLHDGKRGYTLKIYAGVNDRCREIARELNEAKGGSGPGGWTPCEVGKALWTVATMSATGDEDGISAVFGGGSSEKEKASNSSRKRAKKG